MQQKYATNERDEWKTLKETENHCQEAQNKIDKSGMKPKDYFQKKNKVDKILSRINHQPEQLLFRYQFGSKISLDKLMS